MLKKKINELIRVFGYELRRYKENYKAKAFSYDSIFNYFDKWVTKFEINNKEYGGNSDYKTIRISILNEPSLNRHVILKNKKVIEFGPLECGNTILLEKMGASYILAVEGHLENYIRACVIKNIYELNRTKIVYNDAMAVDGQYGSFGIAFVAGLLYHLDRPDIFLRNIARFSDELILSTHIAGPDSPSPDAREIYIRHDGHTYRGKRYAEFSGPNSGLSSYSFWLYREDLLRMIEDAGYDNVNILSESRDPGGYELIYLTAGKK